MELSNPSLMIKTLLHRTILAFILSGISDANQETAPKPNILIICADDLRPELGCYGREHMHTPHIDKLASQGRLFTHHYVNAPTCGVSRYSLLTGKYPRKPSDLSNGVIAARSKNGTLSKTIPALFKDNGYQTISIGKVSHYPGGLGGDEWNDPEKAEIPGTWDQSLMPSGAWKTPRRAMHGVANGVPRTRGETPAIEIKDGDDSLYPDGLITQTCMDQLNELKKTEQPWLLAVGLIKPHLPFTAPKNYWDIYEGKKLPDIQSPSKPERDLTWSKSGEFYGAYNHQNKDPKYDQTYAKLVRRAYYASVSYVDTQVGKILSTLEKSGQLQNTVIILWGDHGWNLGEKAIWGKHNLYEEALHAPLIIATPDMKKTGVRSSAIVETVDIFPTLCELASIEKPQGLDGSSLVSQLQDPQSLSDGIAISFWKNSQSLRTKQYRLTRQTSNGETDYNLFLFPETAPPNSAQVKEVIEELDAQFIKP